MKAEFHPWYFPPVDQIRNGSWGNVIKYRAALPSTNTLAMSLLSEGATEGTIVITDDQTQGRGQKGTVWKSSPGENLTFSLILRPQNIEHRLFALTQVVAIALRETILESCPGEEVLIKWPNDILLNKKKVAGVLAESQWEGTSLKGSVIGMGINLNQVSFEEEISHKATSLALETGNMIDKKSLLWNLLDHLEKRITGLYRGDHPGRTYLSMLYGYQEPVKVRWEDEEGEYPVLGVNSAGHVAIQLSHGIRHFDLKEIEFILP